MIPPPSSPLSHMGWAKSLWLGTDGTWRWRFRTGDRFHHRFWGQVVRWAASGAMAAGNAYVRFGPPSRATRRATPCSLQARISEGITGAGPELLIAAKIYKTAGKTGEPQGEPVAVVPLRPTPDQPRTFGGEAFSLPAGSYVMRLDVPQLAKALELDQTAERPGPRSRHRNRQSRKLRTRRARRIPRSGRSTRIRHRRPRAQ